MSRNLFHPDSGLMITMSQITDCIFLSIFFLLGCIPVVSFGAASAALYDASFRAFRQGEKHAWGRFLQVYRRNFLPGILPTLLYLPLFFLGLKAGVLVWNAVAAGASWVYLSVAIALGALLLGILSVLFPMLSRFDNSFFALLKNTLFLSLAHLPRTLVLGALNGACLFLCVKLVVPLFLLPSLTALLGSFLIEPMFRPYLGDSEGA